MPKPKRCILGFNLFNEYSGLEKKKKELEIQLALRTSDSQILLALSMSYFFYLVGGWFAGALVHWASENKKLLVWKENQLVLDDQMALFLHPDSPTLASIKMLQAISSPILEYKYSIKHVGCDGWV